MCCNRRRIDRRSRALFHQQCSPRSECILRLIGIVALLGVTVAARADGFANSAGAEAASAPINAVQQASHQETEPARLVIGNQDHPLALPPRPGDYSGEKTTGGSRTLGALVSVGFSLTVVVGLFLGVAWLMRRNLPTSVRRLPSEVVETLGRTPLAGRQQMHVLRFGNKLLLVCVSPSGVDTLAEITDPAEIDRVAGLCAQNESTSATKAFRQIFGQLGREKSLPDSSDAARGRLMAAIGEEAADV
jgi:flagellar biogenesis protein FliO